MNIDALAQTLVGIVQKKAAGGQLELPILPIHKARLAAVLQGKFEMSAVLPSLSRDPLLMLECLRFLGVAGKLTYIQDAPALAEAVGAANMRQLLSVAVRRRYNESRDSSIRQIFERICSHSQAVALASHQVAVHAALPEPDTAAFCGAMSVLGGPITAFHLLDLERAASRSRRRAGVTFTAPIFLELIHRTWTDVGRAAIGPYRLPEAIADILDDPEEYDPSDRKSVANCVRMGRHVAVQAGRGIGGENPEQVMAALLIGRSLLEMRDDAVGYLVDAARQI